MILTRAYSSEADVGVCVCVCVCEYVCSKLALLLMLPGKLFSGKQFYSYQRPTDLSLSATMFSP